MVSGGGNASASTYRCGTGNPAIHMVTAILKKREPKNLQWPVIFCAFSWKRTFVAWTVRGFGWVALGTNQPAKGVPSRLANVIFSFASVSYVGAP